MNIITRIIRAVKKRIYIKRNTEGMQKNKIDF
nr:MAG TPA: hypothetical protein [Caudoviricetes sp.]